MFSETHIIFFTLKTLIDRIRHTITLSPEAERHIYTIAKEQVIPKGEIIISPDKKSRKVYFVMDGCLRSYCIGKDGKEHTLQFAVQNWWIGDFIAVYNNEPHTLTVEAVTKSIVIEFNSKDLDEIFIPFPEFEPFQRKNLELHVVSLHKRILNQLQLTAQERYELFLQQYPDIEQYTPNYHIASYLGITQQSLSRIRAERLKKK
ncbi:MAG: Crp/Fnr family transcriptional regulator [Cytophagales bacterium]|nr:Crp/Fnr family transcriptional regulator [Cytophagales bacterium]